MKSIVLAINGIFRHISDQITVLFRNLNIFKSSFLVKWFDFWVWAILAIFMNSNMHPFTYFLRLPIEVGVLIVQIEVVV